MVTKRYKMTIDIQNQTNKKSMMRHKTLQIKARDLKRSKLGWKTITQIEECQNSTIDQNRK